MSVAVLSPSQAFTDRRAHTSRMALSSDSDSDAGYGTPAERLHTVAMAEATPTDSSSDLDGSETETDLELRERVINQVEWYFSDENLLKDSFLMKHINRNQLGYVSLKLVASLRKVKAITKDWKLVQESLRHSNSLILNEEGTKIRRTSPAPTVDFSHISKTILVTHYPEQEPDIIGLEQQFGEYREFSQVRIIFPGRAVPLDVKPSKTMYPSIGKDLCILVEFENENAARDAYHKIEGQQSWRDEMKVHLMKHTAGVATETSSPELVEASHKRKLEKKKKIKSKELKTSEQQPQVGRFAQSHSITSLKSSKLSSGREYSVSPRSSRENTPIQPCIHQRIAPCSHVRKGWNFQGSKCSPELSRKYLRPDAWCNKDYSSDSGVSCGQCSPSPRLTPEPSKRFFSGSSSPSELSWRSSERFSRDSTVVRQPLGPDGSRGFRPRASPISIAVQSC